MIILLLVGVHCTRTSIPHSPQITGFDSICTRGLTNYPFGFCCRPITNDIFRIPPDNRSYWLPQANHKRFFQDSTRRTILLATVVGLSQTICFRIRPDERSYQLLQAYHKRCFIIQPGERSYWLLQAYICPSQTNVLEYNTGLQIYRAVPPQPRSPASQNNSRPESTKVSLPQSGVVV